MVIEFTARRWAHKDLARRLSQLIYGSDECRKDGDRWHVGDHNDWWLHPKPDDRFVLHYRYGQKERMTALAVVLEWRLDVENVTIA
jgi:hypothetical protein